MVFVHGRVLPPWFSIVHLFPLAEHHLINYAVQYKTVIGETATHAQTGW